MRRKLFVCGISVCVIGGPAFWLWPGLRPNVLLITLDMVRADRLGCYEYSAARTPVLDSLAAAGVLCERAYMVAPVTLPAQTSLFTGLYTAEDAIRTNGRGRLDDAVRRLNQALQLKPGYAAADERLQEARLALQIGELKRD